VSAAFLVAGTSSDAGKSVVVAGICRWLQRQGIRVAPFKAQNMSLNAAVTADGSEIGRAQAAQAAAAFVAPEAAMNPVLLKPTGEQGAQVVVMGRPLTQTSAAGYQDLKELLLPVVLDALDSLRSRFDVVVCEGAGGIAEINLRASDLANLGLARAASLPVVVVGDIDRGGVFASLFGSLALLNPQDQALVRAFLINKFRGDVTLLQPGIAELVRRTGGRGVLGVLPWIRGIDLDAEDSLALETPRTPTPPLPGGDRLLIAVVKLPRLSNFTDLDPLAAEPGVEVVFTDSAAELAAADLAVLPGTKATVADLGWLRSLGLDGVLRERAGRGRPVLGICGGYQMLGRCIDDGLESGAGSVEGLGLLPVETVFGTDKVLARPSGVAPAFGATAVDGYEIHHGRVRCHGGEPMFLDDLGAREGCRVGTVAGTSWHGVFESDGFRRAFCSWVAAVRDLGWIPGSLSFAAAREKRLDALGDLIAGNVDERALLGLIEGSRRTPSQVATGAELPAVVTGLSG
jgi:adenosylcobyric acid synthase